MKQVERAKGWSRAWVGLVLAGLMLGGGGCNREAPVGTEAEAEGGPVATKPAPAHPELLGRWYRPDGGYVLELRESEGGGGLTAAYYNPRPINVSNTKVVLENGRPRLMVELKDAGYPGSTYDLVYDSASDQLSGTYYQAALGQTFEVIFVREK